jgi:taurine dioxygenase
MSDAAFDVRPLSVGAEIVGLDQNAPLSAKTRDALYAAWLEYGILLFHGVDSNERHIELSRAFGELELHPFPEIRYKEEPLFIELGAKSPGNVYIFDGSDMRAGRLPWHRDTAFTRDICKGAMLRLIRVPPVGGETMLADTALAYDALPEAMKERLEGLEYKATLRLGPETQSGAGSFWTSVRRPTAEECPDGTYEPDVASRYPSVIHPALLTHPESGRKCLFLSPTYVDYFLGMSQEESDELLGALTKQMTAPQFTYKHVWAPNDAIIWDNRRFIHAAMGHDPKYRRWGLRTTLAGPVQTGRFFDPAAKEWTGSAFAD